jgi:glycosyltransferase involved in cell wall biosynthesis
MKILVTVKFLGLDHTSEGVCSAKFLYSLLEAGLEVVCLAAAQSVVPEKLRCHGEWLKSVKLIPVGHPPAQTSGGPPALRAPGNWAGRFCRRKLGALIVYGTGLAPETWAEIRLWKEMLRKTITRERPDLVFVRGAGTGFEPQMAMAGPGAAVPWVANYHDPFPISLYPEPYRRRFFMASAMQERWNARIIEAADWVSFPSERLLRWMLRGKLAPCRGKGVVIPHIVGELPMAPDYRAAATVVQEPDRFVILHAGSLLEPRQPWGLIEAFRRFAAKDPARSDKAELLFVGGINRFHKADPRWAGAVRTQGVRFIEERVTYAHSLELLRQAAVAVVLEAENAESPFFPAKLADCLLCRKPILALSPAESVASDILGAGYPYRCLASDSARIARILEELWSLWQAGRLAEAAIPPEQVSRFSMKAVGERCKTFFAAALDDWQRKKRILKTGDPR